MRDQSKRVLGDVLKGAAEGIAWVAAATLVLSGCGSGGSSGRAADATGASSISAAAAAATAEESSSSSASGSSSGSSSGSLGTGPVSSVRARSGGAVVVRAAAGADAKVKVTLPATTPLGSARVLMSRGVQGDWVEVFLPTRPNGSTGWVRKTDVVMQTVTYRVSVDLSDRTLVVTSGGKQVLSTRVAVGAAKTPTPVGTFFVTDRVQPTDPKGAYGSFALGLSAHSETLTEFGDGDAQVGIHGTNAPSSIGTATTHGCIRVPDAIARKLEQVPLGTPVEISA